MDVLMHLHSTILRNKVVLAEVTTDAPAPNAMCVSTSRGLQMIQVTLSLRMRGSTLMRCRLEE